MKAKYTRFFLDNDCSITVCQLLVEIFKNISYYAGIMLNAFTDLLCSKLCWHNWMVPNPYYAPLLIIVMLTCTSTIL